MVLNTYNTVARENVTWYRWARKEITRKDNNPISINKCGVITERNVKNCDNDLRSLYGSMFYDPWMFLNVPKGDTFVGFILQELDINVKKRNDSKEARTYPSDQILDFI